MPRSTVGAPGKDTSVFYSDVSHLNMSSSNELPITALDSTTDEVQDRAAKRAATLDRNERRADKRNIGEADVSEDEVVSEDNPIYEDRDNFVIDDEFAKLQNLSPDDFKAALNFSINRAAEAGFAAASQSSSKETPISAAKSSAVFNCYATVFKVADEVSGDEIPHQEIPDCIWKLVQARVPLVLPCITTHTLQFIHSNPTSIKTTKSADGVSQSKELMLDMSAFGDPEEISQTDWQDAWINRLNHHQKDFGEGHIQIFQVSSTLHFATGGLHRGI